MPGYEADDLLGTLARKSEQKGMEVTILSGDRDLLQLATDKVMIRLPKTSKGKTTIENFHTAEVLEKYQVTPPQIIELKALMGILQTISRGFRVWAKKLPQRSLPSLAQ